MTWTSTINSLLVAASSAGMATLLGLIAAMSAARYPRAGKAQQFAWCLILALPPFFVTSGWLYFFGFTGEFKSFLPFNLFSLSGLTSILVFLYWPVAAWIFHRRLPALAPPYWEWETHWTLLRFWRVVLLPFLRPAFATSFLIIFVLSITQFSVPSLLQVKVLPEDVWLRMNADLNYKTAALLLCPMLISIALVLYSINKLGIFKGSNFATSGVAALPPGMVPGLFQFIAWGAIVVSVFLPVAPVAGSLQTWLSLRSALIANIAPLTLSILTAILVPLLIFCCSRVLSGRWMVHLSALLFLAPGLAIAWVLIVVFNRPVLGWFYPSLGCVFLCLIIKYSAPLIFGDFLGIRTNLKSHLALLDMEGAGKVKANLLLAPLAFQELLGPMIVTALLVIWDVETVVMIMPPGRETLSLRVFNMLHYGHNSQINAIGVILMGGALFTAGILICLQLFCRRFFHRILVRCFLVVLTLFSFSCSPKNETSAATGSPIHNSKLFSAVQIIGGKGAGAGQFNKPRSVAVDDNDNLYVVDMTGRVQKFDDHGLYLSSWQMPQTDLGKPKGMCIDQAGNLVLVEPHYSRLNYFSKTNSSLLAQWGVHGTNDSQLAFPRSATVLGDGRTFVTEYGQCERVSCFSAFGSRFLFSFGTPGDGPGQFNRAEGVCSDSRGMLYIADSCNHRVQIFNSDGKFVRAFGSPGRDPGQMNYPYDVRVDAEGYCFVCEFGNSRIQVFKGSNVPVEVIGRGGSEPAEFSNPWSIALDKHGNLFVADAMNHRVQKLLRKHESASRQAMEKKQAL
ncbi:MAG: repeat containing protein [Verrucomicrobiales bacterium]|nr:repeat containing protein [Verrucomicrobiales bacterium]